MTMGNAVHGSWPLILVVSYWSEETRASLRTSLVRPNDPNTHAMQWVNEILVGKQVRHRLSALAVFK